MEDSGDIGGMGTGNRVKGDRSSIGGNTTLKYFMGEVGTHGEVEVVDWAGDGGSVIQSEGHGHGGVEVAGGAGGNGYSPSLEGVVGGAGMEGGVGCAGSKELNRGNSGGDIRNRYHLNIYIYIYIYIYM